MLMVVVQRMLNEKRCEMRKSKNAKNERHRSAAW